MESRPSTHRHALEALGKTDVDDADDDLDLERCFWEEMDDLDSSDERVSSGDDGVGEDNRNELGNEQLNVHVHYNTRQPDDGAPAGWSQFVSSAEGVRKYMDNAAAEISEISVLLLPSPLPGLESLGGAVRINEAVTKTSNDEEKKTRNTNTLHGLSTEDSPVEFPVLPDLVPPEVDGETPELLKPSSRRFVPDHDRCSHQLRQRSSSDDSSSGSVVNAVEQTHRRATFLGVTITTHQSIDKKNESQSTPASGHRLEPPEVYRIPDAAIPSTPKNEAPCTAEQDSLWRHSCDRDVRCTPSAEGSSSSRAPLKRCTVDSTSTQQQLDIHRGLSADIEETAVATASDLPWIARSREKQVAAQQVRDAYGDRDNKAEVEVDENAAQDNVVASVSEASVERRIVRGRERAMEVRQKRWAEELVRTKRLKSAEIVQAVWRGWRARAAVAPAFATRRREVEENNRMLQEERHCAWVAAVQAARSRVQRQRETEELDTMSHEEAQILLAWRILAHHEESARQEDLARMRAEERRGRALLDLEREDRERTDRINREAEERARMLQDDLAAQEERAAELKAMRVGEALSNQSEGLFRLRQAKSRAEGVGMAAEDTASSAWNSDHRTGKAGSRRGTRGRSTPLQRAMDSKGVAAARKVLFASPRSTTFGLANKAPNTSAVGLAGCDELGGFNGNRRLLVERERRGAQYRKRLEVVLQQAVKVRRDGRATVDFSKKVEKNQSCPCMVRKGETATVSSPCSNNERHGAGPGGECGGCSLTAEMLSHLGPSPGITELELCVEGLTSASLLRACTSLKSLSLNVNRFSSPADLVVGTKLVRLSLRDNRLSSLQGMSGLPNLRELRVDINYLTSLHELEALPALVELSANTNHIRELPDGFAARLLLATTTSKSFPVKPSPASKPTPTTPVPLMDIAVEAVACGGLQRLELYHNRISSMHPRALEGLASLTHLDLGRNHLETLDGKGLECCPALSTLVLSQNLLQEPPAPLRLPLLTELWLSGNRIRNMDNWASMPLSPQSVSSANMPRPASEVSSTSGQTSSGRDTRQQIGGNVELRAARVERGDGGQKEGKDGAPDDWEGLWLPSLEVLHLQDNALENMGGRWSLAGAPLLRSLDASFNRLRTPGDFASCLRGCGSTLQDVRLHDNPAANHNRYVDVVVLSCPNLVRMDGKALDPQAHWQAGCNTYMGRADLVLPFLLQTSPISASRLHHGMPGQPVTMNLLRTDQGPDLGVADSASSTAVCVRPTAEALDCPWCSKSVITSSELTGATVCCGGGRVGGSGSGRVALALGEKTDIPRSNPAIFDRCSVGLKTACDSGGFHFSRAEAELWSTPSVPATVRCPVAWQKVRLAGRRWWHAIDNCADGSSKPTVGEDDADTETAATEVFRDGCLQGRDERAAMRRRHRREERDLASTDATTDRTSAASTQSSRIAREVAGEGRTQPQANRAPPSRQRLEIDLKLGETHASERAQLAVRQLSLHLGVGRYENLRTEKRSAYVVVGACCSESPRKAKQEVTLEKMMHMCPAHRHTQAAFTIQRLWRRRRVDWHAREASSWDRGGQFNANVPVKETAATKLQSAFRGFHMRLALQAALDSAKYVDDELDGLLEAKGGVRFDLDRFLSPPPQLAQEWWGDAGESTPSPSTNRSVLKTTSASRHRLQRAADGSPRILNPAFEGGIPLDSKNSSSSPTDGQIHIDNAARDIRKLSQTAEGWANHARGVAAQNTVDDDACGGSGSTRDHRGRKTNKSSYRENEMSRKDMTMKNITSLTLGGESREGGTGNRAVEVAKEGIASSGGGGRDGARQGSGHELISAWGLKDPRVARAMMRRMRRMRKFETSEARRESLKDPDVRFNAFARNAGDHRATKPRSGVDTSRSEHGVGGGSNRSIARSEGGWSKGGSTPRGSRHVGSPSLTPIRPAWAVDAKGPRTPPFRTHLPSLHHDDGTRASSRVDKNVQHSQEQRVHIVTASSTFQDDQNDQTEHEPEVLSTGRPQSTSSSSAACAWIPPEQTLLHYYHRTNKAVTKKDGRPRPRVPLCAHDLGTEAFSKSGKRWGWAATGEGVEPVTTGRKQEGRVRRDSANGHGSGRDGSGVTA